MALPDFSNYDDENLEDARLAILNEKERRSRLTSIPDQVAALASAFAESGGDPAALTAALETPQP